MNERYIGELLANEISDDPPPGFEPLPTGTGFNVYFGPIYGKLVDGKLRLGMRIGRRHINPHDTCHGGVLASFADMQVYVSQQQEPSLRYVLMPTINMSIDYISPAILGDWLESSSTLLRATKMTLFQQTVATAGDRLVFRSSSIYRISGHKAPSGSTLGDLFPNA
ncbi:PaaI family thioesterase [Mesorhizobium sp. L-8-3]|uniref:PaaI family thioesterase n=1 Tax=Mesorhizobium sp. L-8-3 TaxID=2744522 RepID=UPI0019252657|nr:PaaI family thioesterase [Mesorhizobium sp. L-8-3]BCH23494.1 thioesterase [Mesorhizobium sp. L-8-3]